MISDDDFFRLFNACARLAKTPNNPPIPAGSFHDLLSDLNIDSLDSLVLGMYLCDAFGVPEEVGKTMQVRSVGDFKAFLVANATVEQIDVENVISELK
jgi:predicted oxidoreductase